MAHLALLLSWQGGFIHLYLFLSRLLNTASGKRTFSASLFGHFGKFFLLFQLFLLNIHCLIGYSEAGQIWYSYTGVQAFDHRLVCLFILEFNFSYPLKLQNYIRMGNENGGLVGKLFSRGFKGRILGIFQQLPKQ